MNVRSHNYCVLLLFSIKLFLFWPSFKVPGIFKKCLNFFLNNEFYVIPVCLGLLTIAKMTTDTPSQSVASRVMTFTPSKEEFKDFNQYIAYMESQGAHKAGMARVSRRDSATQLCCQNNTRPSCLHSSNFCSLKC